MKLTFIECKRVGFYYYIVIIVFYTIGKGLESSWRSLISHFVFLIITHCLENLFSISLLLSPVSYSYPVPCIKAQSKQVEREGCEVSGRPTNQTNKIMLSSSLSIYTKEGRMSKLTTLSIFM